MLENFNFIKGTDTFILPLMFNFRNMFYLWAQYFSLFSLMTASTNLAYLIWNFEGHLVLIFFFFSKMEYSLCVNITFKVAWIIKFRIFFERVILFLLICSGFFIKERASHTCKYQPCVGCYSYTKFNFICRIYLAIINILLWDTII